MSDTGPHQPVALLLAALGGEGGGVLTSWIVNAAQASGLPVQATSIPGVAQRTGATTYYIEVWPQPWDALNGRAPLLALAPAAGEVDLVVASELLEAARAVRTGWVTPERTLLIASTHRVFTTAEKMQMGDGRFDAETLLAAARDRSRAHVLLNLEAVARAVGAPLNAVLLGTIAGSGALPIPPEAFRSGIETEGKASETNLRGFEAGMAVAKDANAIRPSAAATGHEPASGERVQPLLERIARDFPPPAQEVLRQGVERLVDYQDAAYAALYLERLAPFRGAGSALLIEVARQLALRMSFEDAIRVAQAKIRPERLARVRAETGAGPRDLVVITEFLKPGLEEICDILPAPVARAVRSVARRWPALGRIRPGLYLRTTTLWGYGRLRLLSGLRRWRRGLGRYRLEQVAIEAWLDLVVRAAARDEALAHEVAECARLIKGYGDTHERGASSYARIEAALIQPALQPDVDAGAIARAIAAAREAALADPTGVALEASLRRTAAPAMAGALPRTPGGASAGDSPGAADAAPPSEPPEDRPAGLRRESAKPVK